MNVTYDWNEYFFAISTIIILALFFPIRKYFSRVIVVMIWVYNIGLVASIDYFLLSTPFKLYYFGDNPTYELSASLFHFFMYPCASLLFLFGYDKWGFHGKKTWWYIGGWTGFALFFEWLTVKNHALTYTGWRLYYSIPVYPIAAIMLIILFQFIQKKINDTSLHEFSKILD